LGDEDTAIECKLCFQSLDSAGQKPQLACTREECSQPFHEECLQKWFRSNNGKYSDSCPLCTKCIRDIDNEPTGTDRQIQVKNSNIKLHMRKIVTRSDDGKIWAEIDPACPPLDDPALPPQDRRVQQARRAADAGFGSLVGQLNRENLQRLLLGEIDILGSMGREMESNDPNIVLTGLTNAAMNEIMLESVLYRLQRELNPIRREINTEDRHAQILTQTVEPLSQQRGEELRQRVRTLEEFVTELTEHRERGEDRLEQLLTELENPDASLALQIQTYQNLKDQLELLRLRERQERQLADVQANIQRRLHNQARVEAWRSGWGANVLLLFRIRYIINTIWLAFFYYHYNTIWRCICRNIG